ncbi:MAG: hopanoid-associated sugar epimerase [Actinomycetota bacterium]
MSLALVTGAGGFVGAHVAQELIDHGWTVRALVRPESLRGPHTWPDGCAPAAGDLRDRDAVMRAARGVDAVFHVAAAYSLARHRSREVMRTNTLGTVNVIDAATAAGARLVHTSSVATIGLPADGTPGDEDTPLPRRQTIGAYKRSKLASERLVLDAAARGLHAVVVNPSAPVGPGDWKPTPTGRVIRDFLLGRMPAFVDTGLNLIHVRDVATGHRLALERGTPGRRYILGNENLTLEEILRLLAEVSGYPAPTRRIGHGVAIAFSALDELVEGYVLRREPRAPLDGARMARKRMFFTGERAVRELGVPLTPIRRALEEAVAWYWVNGVPRRAVPRRAAT